MYVLTARLEIGEKEFRRVHSVEIKKSVKQLQNTAIIKIPTTARLVRSGEFVTEVETAKAFQVGDECKINLGYDGNLKEEFRGFVAKIKPQIPFEIEVDDETYLLKRKHLNHSFRKTNLREVIEYVIAGTGIKLVEEIPDLEFDVFYLKRTSAANALQKIAKEYGLRIYFSSWMTLHVGITNENDDTVVKYAMGKNVIKNALEWLSEDDVKLKVKAISVRPDNTRIEVELGDEDGDRRTLWFYNIASKKELEIKAKAEIEKYKYSGYKGNMTTFLLPNAAPGNVASIEDKDFPERSGDYLIESVETKFGERGARRKVELGIKIST